MQNVSQFSSIARYLPCRSDIFNRSPQFIGLHSQPGASARDEGLMTTDGAVVETCFHLHFAEEIVKFHGSCEVANDQGRE